MLANTPVYPTIAVTNIKRAREFYTKKLGLKDNGTNMGNDAHLTGGNGTSIYLYERPTPSGSTATVCSFQVDDVDAAVKTLRNNGITFEEYNTPELKTKNGIATLGDFKAAWFKDPDGNILAVGNALTTKTRVATHA